MNLYVRIYVCMMHGRNRGYALLMTAYKPKRALSRAPTFSHLVSHGGLVHNVQSRVAGYKLLVYSVWLSRPLSMKYCTYALKTFPSDSNIITTFPSDSNSIDSTCSSHHLVLQVRS